MPLMSLASNSGSALLDQVGEFGAQVIPPGGNRAFGVALAGRPAATVLETEFFLGLVQVFAGSRCWTAQLAVISKPASMRDLASTSQAPEVFVVELHGS